MPGDHSERHVLTSSGQQLKPEELLHFIEMGGFAEDWSGLKLDDDDLAALQILIMTSWRRCPVVRGTASLRKLRFAPESWHMGKRGAARVGFVVFEEYGVCLLVVAYAKNERDDLTAQERRAIRGLVESAKRELHRRKSIT